MADNWTGYRRHLGEAVTEYLEFLVTDGLSAGTIKSRRNSLNKMLSVVNREIYVHSVEAHHMSKVWAEVGKSRGNNSKCIDHCSYKQFFAWCETMKYRQRHESPFAHIRRPKEFFPERRRVDEEQFPDLLAAAGGESRFPRDRMYVALGLYSIGRKMEMADVKWGDIDRKNGEFIMMRHKTGQDDVLAIGEELEEELEYYEDWYRWVTNTPAGQPINPEWYVCPAATKPQFIGGRNRHRGYIRPADRMDQQTAGAIVKNALKAIGFEMRNLETGKAAYEGAHTLRRSGARALYNAYAEAGHDDAIRIVQQQLGHATMAQTEKYIGLTLDRKRRNDRIRGKVMYPKAKARREELNAERRKMYSHLRVVS